MSQGGDGRALPKAILFDLDDTILAYDVAVPACWASVCEAYAHRVPGCTAASLGAAIKEYSEWYWSDPERHRAGRLRLDDTRRAIIAEALCRLGTPDPGLAGEMAAAYSSQRRYRLSLFPGAVETLQDLQLRGVRLALITNGEAGLQQAKIDRFDLAKYFDCIVIEGVFGCGKPDERVYRHALRCIGASADDAWMVGDNLEWDVAAPQRLGIVGIWHDHGGQGLPAECDVRPDRIIRRLPELLDGSPNREETEP